MKTAEEQLIEVRVAYIKNLYKGQSEVLINRAIKNIHRMQFDSNEDFESYAKEGFENDPFRQATDDEVDNVLYHMGLDRSPEDKRSSEEKELDDVFRNMSL